MTKQNTSTYGQAEYKQRCKDYTLGWALAAFAISGSLILPVVLYDMPIGRTLETLYIINFFAGTGLVLIAYIAPEWWTEVWEDTNG